MNPSAAPGNAAERYSTLLLRLTLSGQWERALGVAREWLAEEPHAFAAHQAAGQSLINLNQYEPALEHVQQALALNPQSGFVHRLASIVCFYLNLHPRARAHIHEAIRLQPHDAMHWYQLALMAYKFGQPAEAARFARRCLELAPESADAINLLGLCERGNPRQRLAYYQRALELEPENAIVHNNLGVHHLHVSRDYRRAAESFRRALEIDPADKNAQQNLVATFRAGDFIHAVLNFPQRMFGPLAFRSQGINVQSIVLIGVCVSAGGAVLMVVAVYGCWLLLGLPLLKAYEYITWPDLRARAGMPGARRGGVLRFWRWPRAVRVGLLFALYLACLSGVKTLCDRVPFAPLFIAATVLGSVVLGTNAAVAGWKSSRAWLLKRRMERKFRPTTTATTAAVTASFSHE